MDFCKNNQCQMRGCSCQRALDMSQNMLDGCGDCNNTCHVPHLENVALAMVYCPDHEFDCMYSPDEGIEAGTLFRGLDKPFHGRTVCGGGL